MCRAKSRGVITSNGAVIEIAALLIRISTEPNMPSAAPMIAAAPSSLATEWVLATALPPAALISSATASADAMPG